MQTIEELTNKAERLKSDLDQVTAELTQARQALGSLAAGRGNTETIDKTAAQVVRLDVQERALQAAYAGAELEVQKAKKWAGSKEHKAALAEIAEAEKRMAEIAREIDQALNAAGAKAKEGLELFGRWAELQKQTGSKASLYNNTAYSVFADAYRFTAGREARKADALATRRAPAPDHDQERRHKLSEDHNKGPKYYMPEGG